MLSLAIAAIKQAARKIYLQVNIEVVRCITPLCVIFSTSLDVSQIRHTCK